MNRKCKCKHCKAVIKTGKAFLVVENDVKLYFCNSVHYNEYLQLQQKKHQLKEDWDRLYDFVRLDVLGYPDNMKLSSQTIKRLREFEASYSSAVAYETFVTKKSAIDYGLKSKTFTNEYAKMSYVFAIISNNINDIYLKHKTNQVANENLYVPNIDLINQTQPKPPKAKNSSLVEFLDGG